MRNIVDNDYTNQRYQPDLLLKNLLLVYQSNSHITNPIQYVDAGSSDQQFPDEAFPIATPTTYQPRQPPILNEHEKTLVLHILCLAPDMTERISMSLMHMSSENPIDLLPAFAAYKCGLIPRKIATVP